jgi:casein kinase II subunit beta
MSSSSDSDSSGFIESFCASNPLFVAVDDDFIEDTFNLTGLRKLLGDDTERYADALTLILEGGSLTSSLAAVAVKVYGLVHARFVATARGAQLLLEKIEAGAYGECPRHLCAGARMLPLGLSDTLDHQPLKTFCPRCQELYNCSAQIVLAGQVFPLEGSFFGTSATPMLVLSNPHLLTRPPADEPPHRLRIYGFLISPLSNLALRGTAPSTTTAQVSSSASVAPAVAAPVPATGETGATYRSSGGSDVVEDEGDVARNQKKRDRISSHKEAEV